MAINPVVMECMVPWCHRSPTRTWAHMLLAIEGGFLANRPVDGAAGFFSEVRDSGALDILLVC